MVAFGVEGRDAVVAARLESVVRGFGEEMGGRLVVDLVPEPCPRLNLRVELDPRDWRHVEEVVLAEAGGRCAMCGADDREAQLECEALWSYEDLAGIQRLERVVAVCAACRGVMNIDVAARTGTADEALLHLAAVNGWDAVQAEQHVIRAFDRWQRRSRHVWVTDVTHMRKYGVELRAKRAAERDGPGPSQQSDEEDAKPLTIRPISVDDHELADG
jgi:hypothetical protein